MSSSSSSTLTLLLHPNLSVSSGSGSSSSLLSLPPSSLPQKHLAHLVHPEDVALLWRNWQNSPGAAPSLFVGNNKAPSNNNNSTHHNNNKTSNTYHSSNNNINNIKHHLSCEREDPRSGGEAGEEGRGDLVKLEDLLEVPDDPNAVIRLTTGLGSYRAFKIVSFGPSTAATPSTTTSTSSSSSLPLSSSYYLAAPSFPSSATTITTPAIALTPSSSPITTPLTPSSSSSSSPSSSSFTSTSSSSSSSTMMALVLRDRGFHVAKQMTMARAGLSLVDEENSFSVLLERDWTLRHVAPRCSQLTGYGPLELAGLSLCTLCPGEQVERWMWMAEETLATTRADPPRQQLFLGSLMAKDFSCWEMTLAVTWVRGNAVGAERAPWLLRGAVKIGARLNEHAYPGFEPAWDLPFKTEEPFVEGEPDYFLLPEQQAFYPPSISSCSFPTTTPASLSSSSSPHQGFDGVPFTPASSSCPSPAEFVLDFDRDPPLLSSTIMPTPIILSSIPLSPLDQKDHTAVRPPRVDHRPHPYHFQHQQPFLQAPRQQLQQQQQQQQQQQRKKPQRADQPSRSRSPEDSFSHRPQKRRCRKSEPVAVSRCCTSCGTNTTPEWRKGPAGPKTLCNACGLYFAKCAKDQLLQQQQQAASLNQTPE